MVTSFVFSQLHYTGILQVFVSIHDSVIFTTDIQALLRNVSFWRVQVEQEQTSSDADVQLRCRRRRCSLGSGLAGR